MLYVSYQHENEELGLMVDFLIAATIEKFHKGDYFTPDSGGEVNIDNVTAISAKVLNTDGKIGPMIVFDDKVGLALGANFYEEIARHDKLLEVIEDAIYKVHEDASGQADYERDRLKDEPRIAIAPDNDDCPC